MMLNSRLTTFERWERSLVKEETYHKNKDRGTKIAACTNDRGKLELEEDGENLEIEKMIRWKGVLKQTVFRWRGHNNSRYLSPHQSGNNWWEGKGAFDDSWISPSRYEAGSIVAAHNREAPKPSNKSGPTRSSSWSDSYSSHSIKARPISVSKPALS